MWWIYFLFQLSQKRGSIRSPGHANGSAELADLDRVGESLQRRLSSSHTTVRTVRYTAVHKFSATFKYWESMDG